MILVRQEIGEVLRDFRQQKGRTLRQVASRASVALGYLSEVERGQKEASSEILASVAEALDVPISIIMREVGDRISVLEGIRLPGRRARRSGRLVRRRLLSADTPCTASPVFGPAVRMSGEFDAAQRVRSPSPTSSVPATAASS